MVVAAIVGVLQMRGRPVGFLGLPVAVPCCALLATKPPGLCSCYYPFLTHPFQMEPGIVAIIQPALGCSSFEVGGVTYTRTDTLALGRGRLLQKFQTELQFDTTYRGVVDTVGKARAELNAGRWADGLYSFGQLVEKVNIIGANRVRAAEIVGLFYNAPGEDPTTYDHVAFTEKVYTAWGAVDLDFFTTAALLLLARTSTHYQLAPEEQPAPPTADHSPSSSNP